MLLDQFTPRDQESCAGKARRGKQEVDIDSLKGEELDMALAEAIMQFQERNAAALKERYACIVAGGGMLLLMGCKVLS